MTNKFKVLITTSGIGSRLGETTKYINKTNSKKNICELKKILNELLLTKNICNNIESNVAILEQNIDWIGLQIILKQSWSKYIIFGFELNNSNIIQKIFGSILVILVAKDSSKFFGIF